MNIAITQVHLDLGCGRRGTDMGPSAILVGGLVAGLEQIRHKVTSVETLTTPNAESLDAGNPRMRYLPVIADLCRQIANRVERQLDEGHFPLVLGGDHAQAIGTISGMARHFRRQGKKLGVVWVDAHTDMNTPETTPSGNIHGMPLAVLLGHGPRELVSIAGDRPALEAAHVVVLGARDVDPDEARFVQSVGVRVFTMTEIDARGTGLCAWEAFERALSGTAGVHLSFDLDAVDPEYAPGVGTPVSGGLTLREARLICECAAAGSGLVGMEVAELNPTCDLANRTGRLAAGLIHSALGKQILPAALGPTATVQGSGLAIS